MSKCTTNDATCRSATARPAGRVFGGMSVTALCTFFLPTALAAQPAPCRPSTDPTRAAAVVATEAWISARWSKSATTWRTAYTLKPEPKSPLGIAVGGSESVKPEHGQAQVPAPIAIAGLARITSLTCTVYEVGPQAAVVVRYSGRDLQFDENGHGWSRPIPAVLLHVLEVRPPTSANGAPAVVDLVEVRTALPADMDLAVPASPQPPPKPQPAVKRR